MEWRRFYSEARGAVRLGIWWACVAPFCYASELVGLSPPGERPLRLGRDREPYPASELLSRLAGFRGRLRLARALVIVPRALLLATALLVLGRALDLVGVHLAGAIPVLATLLVLW